ncbi:MAG: hypothetical protein IT381_09835 [Deltaproteobacteria bacterium]|nr:hypothetical protein [Deltaproteobacteria bacterium]
MAPTIHGLSAFRPFQLLPKAAAGVTSAAPTAPPLSAGVQRVVSLVKKGDLDKAEEREVINFVRSASAYELNMMLYTVDAHALFEAVENTFGFFGIGGDKNGDALRVALGARGKDIDVYRKNKLITEMQMWGTDDEDEQLITDLILAAKGPELTTLKRLIDLGNESHDFKNLMTDDVDDKGRRAQILAHVKAEAPKATASSPVKIYSDIDDTFRRGWMDPRFPNGAVYPGVKQLYLELDQGPQGGDPTGDLLFLTARPSLFNILEDNTLAGLNKDGIVEASVLEGSVGAMVGNDKIAAKKVANYDTHREYYPEYNSVFIGDNGQGDHIAGEKMLAEKPPPKAVFIHNVDPKFPAAERKRLEALGIVFFDSYVDAAIAAYQKGLISRAGLKRIADAAKADLPKIKGMTAAQLAGANAALNAALVREKAIP